MDLSRTEWRKSSYSSNGGGSCVEVAESPVAVIAVRDSKNPEGPSWSLLRENGGHSWLV